MADAFRLKVVTPSGGVYDEDVAAVTLRSEVGEFCVLPEHCRILAALEPGRMVVAAKDGSSASYAVDEGFVEGGADHLTVIVQQCVAAAEIDEASVKREVDGLTASLAGLCEQDPEREERMLALRWAETKLEIATGRVAS
jgi:F-type H+-transporting ATPase subunit epsilon